MIRQVGGGGLRRGLAAGNNHLWYAAAGCVGACVDARARRLAAVAVEMGAKVDSGADHSTVESCGPVSVDVQCAPRLVSVCAPCHGDVYSASVCSPTPSGRGRGVRVEEELAAKAYVCLHAESSDCMQRSEMWIAQ